MSANARTLPIALVLIGGAIIGTAISAYAFGQRVDLAIVVVAFIIGVFAILSGAGLYYWERNKYYKDRIEIHL